MPNSSQVTTEESEIETFQHNKHKKIQKEYIDGATFADIVTEIGRKTIGEHLGEQLTMPIYSVELLWCAVYLSEEASDENDPEGSESRT